MHHSPLFFISLCCLSLCCCSPEKTNGISVKQSDSSVFAAHEPPPTEVLIAAHTTAPKKPPAPGTPLANVQVQQKLPRQKGIRPQQKKLLLDAKKQLFSLIGTEKKQLGQFEIHFKERQLLFKKADKIQLRISAKGTGYLVYNAQGALRMAGRRTNMGWDLKGPTAENWGRHIQGSLVTKTGTFSAIAHKNEVWVGGPLLGKMIVQGLSIEAAVLLGMRHFSLEERLALAVFVHNLGREHRGK